MTNSGRGASRLCLRSAFTVPKHPESPNEDKWRQSDDGQVFALSDGATISFDAERWARILVEQFTNSPAPDAEWLGLARQTFASAYNREELAWHMQAALDQGSSATLLGLRLREGGDADVVAVGDSLVVVEHGGDVITTYPYEHASDFARTPELLSSNGSEGLQIKHGLTVQPVLLSELPQAVSVLMMTDALGAWCLSSREARVKVLLDITSDEDFNEFVVQEREQSGLKRDDTTLIVLRREPL